MVSARGAHKPYFILLNALLPSRNLKADVATSLQHTTKGAIRGSQCLILFAFLALSHAACATATMPPATIAWVEYMGATEQQVPWAHMVRGFKRGSTGMDSIRRVSQHQQPFGEPVTLGAGVHTVIILLGALPYPGQPQVVTDYFNMVAADQSKAWQSLLRNQGRNFSNQLPGHQIYWEVGNEINSCRYGLNVASLGGGNGSSSLNQPDLISIYAEKVLAPAYVALHGSSQSDAPGSARPRIIIGTVAFPFLRETQQWMMNLLDYTLKGTLVPSLKGRRVSSLGDVVGIHYLLTHEGESSRTRFRGAACSGGDYPSKPEGEDWRVDLNHLYSEVVGSRHMQGLWLTEEIGINYPNKGFGGATALKVWARFMSWVSVNNLKPEQTRLNFWGSQLGPSGSRGNDAMDYLYGQIGASPISVIGDSEFTKKSYGELYAFKTAESGGALVIMVANGRASVNKDIGIPAEAVRKQVSCKIFGRGGGRSVSCNTGKGKLHVDTFDDFDENDVLVAVLK